MFERIFGKKYEIPEKYGTITRRETRLDGTIFEKEESILLRQSEVIWDGGVFSVQPRYETRSEKVLIKPEFLDEGSPPKFKIVTKQVKVGYKLSIDFQSFFRPIEKSEQTVKKDRLVKCSISLLRFFLPRNEREQVIGDILEDFDDQKKHLGSFANIWLLKEVLSTLAFRFLREIARVIDWFRG